MVVGPPTPSDEAWAERGVFLCYGRADLSYAEVAALLELANLAVTPEDFRNAAEVVWAYRLCPPATATDAAAATGPAPAPATPTVLRGNPTDGGCQLIGFAAADCCGGSGPEAAVTRAPGGDAAVAVAGGGERGGARQRRGRGPRHLEDPAHPASMSAAKAIAPGITTPTTTPTATSTTHPTATPTATVWFLAVHPACRRRGLGRALLERLLAAVRERSGASSSGGGSGDGGRGGGGGGGGAVTLRSTSRAAALYDSLPYLVRDPDALLVKGRPALPYPAH
ncbi:hypothetical protein TSOC_008126 [Tetrabaena socialis]|uniref:N-acetyltransferase domain-containing protein n=1 Tax=Tetrabaena socialis TaxID=47790 RepID=A0A2J7ZZC9_9CHLO|nr:hypothetical protein TSOC_008126 [Tetrabaena socialis]|eukprot:PNH05634.1 hypothetical protein TSOC_008126 [Tetrabaena socialis]